MQKVVQKHHMFDIYQDVFYDKYQCTYIMVCFSAYLLAQWLQSTYGTLKMHLQGKPAKC